jgi:hypothetical protein
VTAKIYGDFCVFGPFYATINKANLIVQRSGCCGLRARMNLKKQSQFRRAKMNLKAFIIKDYVKFTLLEGTRNKPNLNSYGSGDYRTGGAKYRPKPESVGQMRESRIRRRTFEAVTGSKRSSRL